MVVRFWEPGAGLICERDSLVCLTVYMRGTRGDGHVGRPKFVDPETRRGALESCMGEFCL